MVRPRKNKLVNFKPDVTYFKPRAISLSELEEVELTIDELETLRLSNLKKLNQIDSAKKMKIHQSTFQRTLSRAREKITDALVNGKAIKIKGGDYIMPGRNKISSKGCERGKQNMGPGGVCLCPNCGYEQTHIRGQPCNQIKCPECNSLMTRK